jgi:hypothetical protein
MKAFACLKLIELRGFLRKTGKLFSSSSTASLNAPASAGKKGDRLAPIPHVIKTAFKRKMHQL